MEVENCWVCGSQMLNKSVLSSLMGDWIIIQCNSCFAELVVTPIGGAKNGKRRLPGKDGMAGV